MTRLRVAVIRVDCNCGNKSSAIVVSGIIAPRRWLRG